jgi:hypothetical protein
MTQAIKWLYLLGLGTWLGSVIFFSAVVAPTVFQVLTREDAAKLQRKIFPRYYLVGLVCALTGVVCVGWLLFERSFGKWPGIFSLLLLMSLGGTTFWLRQTVAPRMELLRTQREQSPEASAEWSELHRLSVQLNIATLVGLLALLFLLVFSRVV